MKEYCFRPLHKINPLTTISVVFAFFSLTFTCSAVAGEITRKSIQGSSLEGPPGWIKEAVFYKGSKQIARVVYNPDGTMVKQTGRIPDGEVKEYFTSKDYATGKPKPSTGFWVGKYHNGKLQGACTSYYAFSQILRVENFDNGILNGLVQQFWENGNPATEAFYVNGKKEGKEKSFDKYGTLTREIEFKNGFKDGVEREYKENGDIAFEAFFLSGREVSRNDYEEHIRTKSSSSPFKSKVTSP